MNLELLSRPARRFLTDRLELLREALETLGQRLRASIAAVVGSQVGTAIRDALGTALHVDPSARHFHGSASHIAPERPDDVFHESDMNQDAWYAPHAPPEPPPEPKPARWSWLSLFTGGVQMASWWLQHRPPRRTFLQCLGIGTVAGLATLLVSPVIGGIVATVGTTVLLMTTADAARHTASHLAGFAGR